MGAEPILWLIGNVLAVLVIVLAYFLSLIGIFRLSRNIWIHIRGKRRDESIRGRMTYGAGAVLTYRTLRFAFLVVLYFLTSELFEILFQTVWFVVGVFDSSWLFKIDNQVIR